MPGHIDESESIADKLHGVLSEFFRADENAMLIKWTLQAEVIDHDGTSAMWTLCSPGMAIWERQSFTRYALKYYDWLQIKANEGGND